MGLLIEDGTRGSVVHCLVGGSDKKCMSPAEKPEGVPGLWSRGTSCLSKEAKVSDIFYAFYPSTYEFIAIFVTLVCTIPASEEVKLRGNYLWKHRPFRHCPRNGLDGFKVSNQSFVTSLD